MRDECAVHVDTALAVSARRSEFVEAAEAAEVAAWAQLWALGGEVGAARVGAWVRAAVAAASARGVAAAASAALVRVCARFAAALRAARAGGSAAAVVAALEASPPLCAPRLLGVCGLG